LTILVIGFSHFLVIMSPSKRKPIGLDGTTLEGGGQILRLALALSSLTGKPIQIDKIRGNRGTKAKDGGIKQAHLGGAAWLTRASEAATEGLALRSRDLLFEPGLATAKELKDVQKSVLDDGVTIGQAFRKYQPGTKCIFQNPLPKL
jgi:RNA 3'-terminal phosphate cyclase (ATP)